MSGLAYHSCTALAWSKPHDCTFCRRWLVACLVMWLSDSYHRFIRKWFAMRAKTHTTWVIFIPTNTSLPPAWAQEGGGVVLSFVWEQVRQTWRWCRGGCSASGTCPACSWVSGVETSAGEVLWICESSCVDFHYLLLQVRRFRNRLRLRLACHLWGIGQYNS